MQLSIIIVNYNTKSLLRNCLTSVYDLTSDITFEIIVSDNGSTDGSIEMLKTEFPQVILIENNANLGFGAANNRALDIAKGKYIFYLNSDTVLLNNACKIFYDYWESAQNKDSIGAIGANLLDKDNNVLTTTNIDSIIGGVTINSYSLECTLLSGANHFAHIDSFPYLPSGTFGIRITGSHLGSMSLEYRERYL